MHRVGRRARGPAGAGRRRGRRAAARLEGLWTHLPVADGEGAEDRAYTVAQLDLFDDVCVAELGPAGVDAADAATPPTRPGAVAFPPARATTWCAAASASTATCPGRRCSAAFAAQAGGGRLRPAMALKARVVAVRTLEAGERPSYGRLRPLPARSVVATVPIGYADGVPRALFGAGYEVLIGGGAGRWPAWSPWTRSWSTAATTTRCARGTRWCCSAGRATRTITADDWAALLGTISYEVVCGVGPRMPRILVNRPDARPGDVTPPRSSSSASTRRPAPCARWPRDGPRSSSVWGARTPTCSSSARARAARRTWPASPSSAARASCSTASWARRSA